MGDSVDPDVVPDEDEDPITAPTPAPQPTSESGSEDEVVVPPVLDTREETKAVRDFAPAPAPDGDDNFESFILRVEDQNDAKNSDKQLETLLGIPEVGGGGGGGSGAADAVAPKAMGTGEYIGRTASEMLYKAPVKGVRDAAQETINLVMELGNQLNTLTEGTPLDLMSRPVFKDGKFFPNETSNVKEDQISLPDPGEMQTGAGVIEESIIQFLAGFVGAGKALKGVNVLQKAPLTKNLAQGFLGTFAAFDGNEQRLGNLIEAIDPDGKGGVMTDVLTYLKAEEDDPELLGRFKAGIEDMGGGVLVDGVVRGIRALRTAMRIKHDTKSATYEEAARKVLSGDAEAALKADAQPVDVIDNMLGSTHDEMVHNPNSLPTKGPIPAYHGTLQNFDKFDPKKLGSSTGGTDTGEGFFFSNKPEDADMFASKIFMTPDDLDRIAPEDLDKFPGALKQEFSDLIESTRNAEEDRFNYAMEHHDPKNPDAVYETPQYKEFEDIVNESMTMINGLAKQYLSTGANIRPTSLNLENSFVHDAGGKPVGDFKMTEIVKKAKAAGHDGVTFKNLPDDREWYVAFDPNKIRSRFEGELNVQSSQEIKAGFAPVQYGGQTVNVNFGRIDTPADLRVAIDEIKKVPKPEPEKPRRAAKISGQVFEAGPDEAHPEALDYAAEKFGGIDSPEMKEFDARPDGKMGTVYPGEGYVAHEDDIIDLYAYNEVDPDLAAKLPAEGLKKYKDIVKRAKAVKAAMKKDDIPEEIFNEERNLYIRMATEIRPYLKTKAQLTAATPQVGRSSAMQNLANDPLESANVAGSKGAYELILRERDARIKRGQSTPLTAEDQEALKSLWVSSSNKLNEVIKTARASPTPENLFAFRKMLSTFGVINNELMGIRHETNRAVNVWAKSEKIPMRRMKDIEEVLERTGGVEDNKKLLDQLSRHIDSSPDAALALSKMSQASRRYGTTRAIRNFWTLGLLTNWKTHEVNAISNTLMMFVVASERAAASRMGQVLGDPSGVAPGEASAMLSGMWHNLADAVTNAGRTMRTGEGGGAFNKVEQPFEHVVYEDADTSLKKLVNTSMWYWGGIGRALQASDEFFKTLNMGAEINALTTRQAYHEMMQGKITAEQVGRRVTELRNNVPEDILLKAEDTARYATFTKEPGNITKKFARWVNAVPGGRYIIPFINTPSNLLNATLERTPFAPLQKNFRDAVRRGGPDAQIAMTKMSLGLTLMSMSMSKSFDDEITGSGPPFWSKEYAQWKATGRQPYSVKIGDKWVAYNRFDPMGMVLGIGADMAEKLKYMDDFEGDSINEYEQLFAGAAFSLASQVMSKTYMQGAANLFDALNNEQISAKPFVDMFAGSFIPSGVGEVARIVDPVHRQTYDFITKWKSRTPGKSAELEPKLDMWGREIKYGSGNVAIDILNPVTITKENVTPADREFELQGWSIPKDVRQVTEDGVKINFKGRPELLNFMQRASRAQKPSEMDMNNPDVKKLQRKYGDYSLHELFNLIVTANHPLYRKYAKKSEGPDGDKVGMLKKIYRDYYNAAKSQAMDQFPELKMEIEEGKMKSMERASEIAEERKRQLRARPYTPAGDSP